MHLTKKYQSLENNDFRTIKKEPCGSFFVSVNDELPDYSLPSAGASGAAGFSIKSLMLKRIRF
jgi:hypothetical protein